LVDSSQLLDIGLKEGLCRRVIEAFDVGFDVFLNILEGANKAVTWLVVDTFI
jgi:hypothetical protein